MIQFQENTQTDGRRKDGQTLFHRILPATAGGLTTTTAIESHLKVEDIEYNVCLEPKIIASQSAWKTNQLNSYTQSADFRVSWSKWPLPFLTIPPKNQWNNFELYWICICRQKISSFHLLILEIQSILESCDQTRHTHFWPCPPKKILINF